jgi:hypothetical protein
MRFKILLLIVCLLMVGLGASYGQDDDDGSCPAGTHYTEKRDGKPGCLPDDGPDPPHSSHCARGQHQVTVLTCRCLRGERPYSQSSGDCMPCQTIGERTECRANP